MKKLDATQSYKGVCTQWCWWREGTKESCQQLAACWGGCEAVVEAVVSSRCHQHRPPQPLATCVRNLLCLPAMNSQGARRAVEVRVQLGAYRRGQICLSIHAMHSIQLAIHIAHYHQRCAGRRTARDLLDGWVMVDNDGRVAFPRQLLYSCVSLCVCACSRSVTNDDNDDDGVSKMSPGLLKMAA